MSRTAVQSFAGGRYRVERQLGRGGMATVFLAQDVELHRTVAVKVLDGRFAGDEGLAQRFRREARTAAGLQHPNVVSVFDTGEEEGRLFIVMEHVDGEGLDELLERRGTLPVADVLALARQACAGLGYAHEQGVVHRDVKPANLLLRQDGTLKVTDFGIARAADAGTQLTQAGTILGTAAYLAPEQARGEPVGPRADVFALGVVLYEALTGRVPWPVEALADLGAPGQSDPPPIREVVPDVPPALEAAVARGLAREPGERPADANRLAAELDGAAPADATATLPQRRGEAPTVALTGGWLRRGHRARPRWGMLAALLTGLVLAVGLGIAALTGGDDGGAGEEPSERPARVQPAPALEDPAEQARALEEWIRDHTRPAGE